MAYGVTTRMYLASEPEARLVTAGRTSAIWRQLQADERLRAVEQLLKKAA